MTRLRMAVACLMLAGLLAMPVAGAEAGGSGKMLRKVNNVRAKHGLRPLRAAPALRRSANRYAGVMMSRGFFGHSSNIKAPGRWRRLGEAIAYTRGSRPNPRRTLRQWMHSPGHRALILSSSFRRVGAGVSAGRYRGRRASIWVLHLGAR